MAGHDMTWHARTWHDRTGQDGTGRDVTWQDMTWCNTIWQDMTLHDKIIPTNEARRIYASRFSALTKNRGSKATIFAFVCIFFISIFREWQTHIKHSQSGISTNIIQSCTDGLQQKSNTRSTCRQADPTSNIRLRTRLLLIMDVSAMAPKHFLQQLLHVQ